MTNAENCNKIFVNILWRRESTVTNCFEWKCIENIMRYKCTHLMEYKNIRMFWVILVDGHQAFYSTSSYPCIVTSRYIILILLMFPMNEKWNLRKQILKTVMGMKCFCYLQRQRLIRYYNQSVERKLYLFTSCKAILIHTHFWKKV